MLDPSRSRWMVLGAATLFSTGGVGIKWTSLPALEVAFGRSLVAAIVLFLILPGWRRFWKPKALGIGVFYAMTLVCFVAATKYTMSANAIFLQSTAPIYVLLLAPKLLAEPNRRSDYVIMGVLMTGLALFFLDVDPATETAPDPRLGNALAIVSGFCLALVLMGLRWLGREESEDGGVGSGEAALAGNVIAALVCAPFVLPMSGIESQDVLLVGYLGVVQIGLGYWMLTGGLRGVPAVEVSMLLLAEPVLNGLWAWIALGERPGFWSLIGCMLIGSATCARVMIARSAVVAFDEVRET